MFTFLIDLGTSVWGFANRPLSGLFFPLAEQSKKNPIEQEKKNSEDTGK